MVPIEGDDELLRRVGRAARERSGEGPLSEWDLDAQVEKALAEYGEEAFGKEFQAGVVSRLREAQRRNPPRQEVPPAPKKAAVAKAPVAQAQWPRRAALAASLVLAVSGLTWGLLKTFPGELPGPLPVFELVQPLGVAGQRSSGPASGDRIDVVPGFRFSVRLRPVKSVSGDLGLRIFAVDEEGRVERWMAGEQRAETSGQGVISLDDPAADDWQGFRPGDYELYFAVGRPGTLPSARELRARIDGEAKPTVEGWQLLVQGIRFAERL